ncbi:YHS domain-containing protein [Candidatus Electronema sp. JC]|uniref:YHS domain-containing protein n=1 Tax=Candidatus Electronema sp. JC TaxID=3401570 RepID=UPI003B434E7E
MNPLRLLLLAALVYVVWRLLRRQLHDRIQAELLREQERQEAAEDVLVEDPVCGILIPKQEAVRLRQDGRTYYFCSESCCDAFTGGTKGQDE